MRGTVNAYYIAGCGKDGEKSGRCLQLPRRTNDAQSALDARYCVIDFLERVVERRGQARDTCQSKARKQGLCACMAASQGNAHLVDKSAYIEGMGAVKRERNAPCPFCGIAQHVHAIDSCSFFAA